MIRRRQSPFVSIGSLKSLILSALTLLVLAPSRAVADFAYAGSSGSLTAKVIFAQSGTNLILTLANITSADTMAQADVWPAFSLLSPVIL